MQMIRLNNFVGIRYNILKHSDNFEIFDVTKDFQQAHNLAIKPGMEVVQQQMKDKVLQSRRPNTEAKRPYDDELVPAVPEVKNMAGVEWKTYAGNFPWVPDITTLKPSESGTSDCPNASLIKNTEAQIVFYTGYLQIPADGEYSFYLNANGGAFLRIHDAAIIDADFGYTSGTERNGIIKLKAGLHPYRLYYAKKAGIPSLLNFQWSSQSIEKQAVPASVFHRKVKI